jgi:hypothetical protein
MVVTVVGTVVVTVVVAAAGGIFKPVNFNYSDRTNVLQETASSSRTSYGTSKTEQRKEFKLNFWNIL